MSMSKWDKVFSYESLVHACAGSVGAMTGMTVFYPLDTVRSRIQLDPTLEAKDTIGVLMEIFHKEGLEGIYRGIQPVLSSICVSNFVYFYTFHGLRAVYQGEKKSALIDLSLGALAGAINVMSTTPVWVVNTRLKMQGIKGQVSKYPEYQGLIHGLITISGQEGIPTLWSGAKSGLLLVSSPSIQYMVYESLKRRVQQMVKSDQLTSMQVLMVASISKTISTIITYPLQLIQSKARYGSEDVKNKSILDIVTLILEKEGSSGLYKGIEAKIGQTVLTTALMFLAYEKIVAFVFTLMNVQKGSKSQ